ncbi:DUF2339 domain-containing protein [Flavobacterium channae]|uniref:DUF2339 domain-containing protein n=1 Tax=Flavobacterium channae TaxID=2897181 RepID=UPI001E30AC2E|nr:DUF2339 domain-containing protein [Flavobacterium channae]UGS24044.1 DUF2339 domain-containing protein [Flavobacterium channae]
METILLIAILIIVIVILTSINSKFQNLQETVYSLHEKINDLRDELYSKTIQETPKITTEIQKETVSVVEPVIEEKVVEKPIEVIEKAPEIVPVVESVKEEIREEIIPQVEKIEPVLPREPEKSWFETFKENNPDLEKFIGENLINKIGILILVLGISFFVKYAIDKDWINETARVGIGILAGSLVMGVAHKLKKNYQAFSSVMVAGAISIFYFTIAIAFHDYHLFSQTVAFAIMVVITAFSTFVSVVYNRQELAVLSSIGGFAVPFMVSTGEGNYVVLFTYIAILNIGILGIAYFKKWNIVTILSFVFTNLLLFSWYNKELYADKLPHQGALVFATLFYFIFSIVAVLNNVRRKGEFSTIDYFIVVANTFLYFGIGMGILHNWGINYKGLFTLSLAVYNLIYVAILFKKFGLDKNAVYLLIGLVLTFLTLTIPIQFEGNQITLFWAIEAVLLFWLSQKSKISLFKLSAMLVQFLAIISLIIDWEKQYRFSNTELSILINPIFITGIVVLASLIGTYFLFKKENEVATIFKFEFDPVMYRNGILWIALIIGYFVGILEIIHQAGQNFENESTAFSLSVCYHFIFSTVFIFLGLKSKEELLQKIATVLAMANIVLYVVWWYNIPSKEVLWNITKNWNSSIAFNLHYIILGCLIYYIVILANQILDKTHVAFLKSKIAIWLLVFCGVYILSNELIVHHLFSVDRAIILKQIDEDYKGSNLPMETFYLDEYVVQGKLDIIKTQVVKIGYPILWGILSFALLIYGIKRQWKQLRIIALSLLGLTILKLFAYDINNVSETGKIIAFILLGVLILIISFVYQKIKKLVVDETQNVSSNEESN